MGPVDQAALQDAYHRVNVVSKTRIVLCCCTTSDGSVTMGHEFSFSGVPGERRADHSEASSFSAILHMLVTLFQFLPVPGVFKILSMTGQDSFGRAMPWGK